RRVVVRVEPTRDELAVRVVGIRVATEQRRPGQQGQAPQTEDGDDDGGAYAAAADGPTDAYPGPAERRDAAEEPDETHPLAQLTALGDERDADRPVEETPAPEDGVAVRRGRRDNEQCERAVDRGRQQLASRLGPRTGRRVRSRVATTGDEGGECGVDP